MGDFAVNRIKWTLAFLVLALVVSFTVLHFYQSTPVILMCVGLAVVLGFIGSVCDVEY